jgi:hypothetical protein
MQIIREHILTQNTRTHTHIHTRHRAGLLHIHANYLPLQHLRPSRGGRPNAHAVWQLYSAATADCHLFG